MTSPSSAELSWARLTETPTYALDGMLLNATDDFDVDWIVTEEVGWSDAAPVRMTVADREDDHGGVSGPVWRGPRLINLKGVAIARSRLNMLWAKERLRACACTSTRDPYELVVDEEHMVRMTWVKHFAEAKIRDRGATAFEWELSLRADDPFRYATTVTSVVLGLPTTPVGGLVFAPSPGTTVFQGGGVGFTFGAPIAGGSDLLSNPGNTPVAPVLHLTGPLTNPVVTNLSTGQVLALEVALAAGDTVVADHGKRTITLNNAPRFDILSRRSSWWQVDPGTTEVQFEAATGSVSVPELTITFRPAWK